MIEMLGVLAIIGVLSAGGIWGYNQAMSAYTFNKFVKDVSTTVSAATQAFPRPKRHSQKIQITTPADLKAIGVLSDDLYKTVRNNFVKNPFISKYNWKFYIIEEPIATTEVWTGLTVPKNICVKILTYDWSGVAPKRYMIANRTKYSSWGDAWAHKITSPSSVATAKTECDTEEVYISIIFYIHDQLNW